MRNFPLLCAAAIAVVAFGLVAGAQEGPKPSVRTLKPGQVARVGENIITAEQFIQRMVDTEKLTGKPASVPGVLEILLAERMLEAEAQRIQADLKPRELQSEIDRTVAEAKAQYDTEAKQQAEQQRQLKLPEKPWTWAEWLDMKTGLTEGEFVGLVRIKARNDLTKRLVIWYWFASSPTIDIKLIRCAKKETIEKARDKALGGASFDALVNEFSEHPSARQSEPGMIAQIVANDGTVTPEVDQAAWKLKDGEVSGVIASDESWYMVKRVRSTPPNEARFFDLRESLLAKPNVNDNMLNRWRNTVTASGRYVVERRLPGLDCEADQ